MTMRLHTNPLSAHARRVSMAIHELGLDSEIKVLDFGKGEHKDGAYLAHNPNGKVPMLEDNGFWLWESNAILCYLADKKPEKNLYPTDAHGRADVNRWLFWESAHMGNACAGLTAEHVVKPMLLKMPTDANLVPAAPRCQLQALRRRPQRPDRRQAVDHRQLLDRRHLARELVHLREARADGHQLVPSPSPVARAHAVARLVEEDRAADVVPRAA